MRTKGEPGMRYLVTAAALALATAPPAVGQDVTALAIEGWRSDVGRDSIVYYRCASDICAAGSGVSHKSQPHHGVTLAQLRSITANWPQAIKALARYWTRPSMDFRRARSRT